MITAQKIYTVCGIKFILLMVIFTLPSLGTAKENSLRQQLEFIHKQTEIGAVSYALVEGNKIIETGGIGYYGLDDSRLVTANSLFRIGSITKTFTALAIMREVEKGGLNLEQSLKSILPNIPLNNPWLQSPVTLEMLLEHTAGLQDLTRAEFNYPVPLSLQQAFKLKPEARKILWQPGYHFSYSNVGAGYLGRAIEAINKENFDQWFEREILGEFDMQDSQLHWTEQLEGKLVTGYDSDLKTEISYWHTLFRPFGGLNTTANDMAKFLLLFTGDNDKSEQEKKVISSAGIMRMETPTTSLAAKVGLETGYGLAIRNEYFKGHKIYGHGGDADGYLAKFSYSKQSRRGYFVVINGFRHDILNEFTELLNNWLIEGLPRNNNLSKKIMVKQLTAKEEQKIIGDYMEITSRFTKVSKNLSEMLRIKILDNKLLRCFPHLKKCKEIMMITKNLFRTKTENKASMAFIQADDGKLYLQADFGNYMRVSRVINE